MLSARSAAAALLIAAGSALAQPAVPVAEHQLKAAFLYKFLGFVEWPAQAFQAESSPLVIAVAGAPGLADELTALVAGRTVNGRALVVNRHERADAAPPHQVLFVGRGASRATAFLASSGGRSILTVTEADDSFPAGSMINFVVVDGKVRFDVDVRRAESENLKISARLLSVARKTMANAP